MMFNGNELRLARQYLGFSLNEIAESIGTSRQYVHQLETGRTQPQSLTVELLANLLNVKKDFFFGIRSGYFTEEQCHFRKNIGAKVADQQTVKARGVFFERLIEYIDSNLKLPEVDLPEIELDESTSIENAAEQARKYWSLGLGPIDNMIRVVENAGVVVTYFEGVSNSVDALSITSSRPIIVRNDNKASPYRLRFDLAHELAHLLLHEGQITGDRATEAEANKFASAFLMPRTTFAKDFIRYGKRGTRLNWKMISELKLKWKVTKSAMFYRAYDLGLLDLRQYKSAVISLKNKKESIIELEDPRLEKEQYELFEDALQGLNDFCGISIEQLADDFNVSVEFLSKVMGVSGVTTLPPHKPNLRLVS